MVNHESAGPHDNMNGTSDTRLHDEFLRSSSYVIAFLTAGAAKALEDGPLGLEAQHRSHGCAGEGVGEHLQSIPEHEHGTVRERRPHMAYFHPPFGAPPQELDV